MAKQKKEKPRNNKKIKKEDQVFVISGNDRGQTGPVLNRTNDRVIIQGVNMRKRHVKKSQENPQGGVVEMERPIHISNVRLLKEKK